MGVRFLQFTVRTPRSRTGWIDYRMAVLEDAVCSSQEENDRWLFGELICSLDWDDPERSEWLFGDDY